MDARVISAFTRVFPRAVPAHDKSKLGRVLINEQCPNSLMLRRRRQRAVRSLRVRTPGTARGAFVRSSKNGVGRPSPRTHQPSILDARQAKTPSDGGPGAFGGGGPTAEVSWVRQSRRPRHP